MINLHKYLYPIILLIFVSFANAKEILIPVGDSILIPLSGNQVWVEKKAIIKAAAKGSKLIVYGLKNGTSFLKTKSELYHFQVIAINALPLFKKINSITTRTLGLNTSTKDSKIVIEGTLFRLNDWIRLAKKMSSNEQYFFKAQLSEDLKIEAQNYFNQLFKEAGLLDQKIQFGIYPELRLPPKDNYFKKYQEVLAPFGILVIEDKLAVNLAPIVKIQITIAEVNRGFIQNYGLKIPESFTTSILPKPEVKDFDSQILALENSGQGRILASPNILCRSGKGAEFFAGGEFPIKMMTRYRQDVVWKKYGIMMKVQPIADSLGRMSISIQTEISSIDKSLSADNIPAISTNKVSSHFDLTESKTIALSGLLKDIQGESSEGFPGLSRLPVLGNLFSSKEFINKKTELIIFVRPEIVRTSNDEKELLSNNKPKHLRELSWKQQETL